MKSHYSIISAVIRPEIGERIAIGLLLVGIEKIIFRLSKDKVGVVKELVTENTYKFLKESLRQITVAVDCQQQKMKPLFTQLDLQNSLFTEGYLEYLSRYSTNLLNFTKPKIIELPVDEDLFLSLFNKYIDESVVIVDTNRIKTFDSVKSKFFPRVKKFYNLELELTPESVPKLPMPLKIDIIGRNDRIVYAQSIDLERTFYHIQNDIGILAILNQVFQKKAEKFVISSEPNKTIYPKQHKTWINLRSNDLAKYIDLNEIDLIKKYAVDHGVLPFFQQ
jgi:hypothetical protein